MVAGFWPLDKARLKKLDLQIRYSHYLALQSLLKTCERFGITLNYDEYQRTVQLISREGVRSEACAAGNEQEVLAINSVIEFMIQRDHVRFMTGQAEPSEQLEQTKQNQPEKGEPAHAALLPPNPPQPQPKKLPKPPNPQTKKPVKLQTKAQAQPQLPKVPEKPPDMLNSGLTPKQVNALAEELRVRAEAIGGRVTLLLNNHEQVDELRYHRDIQLPLATVFHEYWRSYRAPQRTTQTLDFVIPRQLEYAQQCIEHDEKIFHKLGLRVYEPN